MNDFKQLFFNDISPGTFLFTLLCFIAGFAVFHYLTVKKGVRTSATSPVKFSLKYWFNDNGGDVALFIIIAYLSIRFTPEVLSFAGAGDVFSDYTGTPFAFVILGFGYERLNAAIRRAASRNKTNMENYTEQPTPRNTATLATSEAVEYFQWRDSDIDPWQNEVQYTEIDSSSPSGFWVYWRYYTTVQDFTSQTLEHFKNVSFPRKPGKRGGTPSGQ